MSMGRVEGGRNGAQKGMREWVGEGRHVHQTEGPGMVIFGCSPEDTGGTCGGKGGGLAVQAEPSKNNLPREESKEANVTP